MKPDMINVEVIQFREWELIVDKELTKQTYDKIETGSPESCGCNDCNNFILNREIIYPDEIKKLLCNLGIDYQKESEVWSCCQQENGVQLYSGWFHFKGQFKGKNCMIPTDTESSIFDLTPVNENFSIGFRYDNALTYFDDKNDIVQIEFSTSVTL